VGARTAVTTLGAVISIGGGGWMKMMGSLAEWASRAKKAVGPARRKSKENVTGCQRVSGQIDWPGQRRIENRFSI
jgi:hypothetical protein